MIDTPYCFAFWDMLCYAILLGAASFACGAFGAVVILRAMGEQP